MNKCVFCNCFISEGDTVVTLKYSVEGKKLQTQEYYHADCYEQSIKNRTVREAVMILNKYKDTAVNLFQILKDNKMARDIVIGVFSPEKNISRKNKSSDSILEMLNTFASDLIEPEDWEDVAEKEIDRKEKENSQNKPEEKLNKQSEEEDKPKKKPGRPSKQNKNGTEKPRRKPGRPPKKKED